MQCGHTSRVRTLYKVILKLHRGLPNELKLMGDNYVKDEFRRNKVANVQETIVFMNEWTVSIKYGLGGFYLTPILKNYAMGLAHQLGVKGPGTAMPVGAPLTEGMLDQMTEDQVQQLYDLMLAAVGENPDEGKSDGMKPG